MVALFTGLFVFLRQTITSLDFPVMLINQDTNGRNMTPALSIPPLTHIFIYAQTPLLCYFSLLQYVFVSFRHPLLLSLFSWTCSVRKTHHYEFISSAFLSSPSAPLFILFPPSSLFTSWCSFIRCVPAALWSVSVSSSPGRAARPQTPRVLFLKSSLCYISPPTCWKTFSDLILLSDTEWNLLLVSFKWPLHTF